MFKSLKIRKLTSLLVAFMMFITIISPASAVKVFAEVTTSKTIHIVEVTDFHGTLLDSSGNQVGAVLSNRIKAVKAANPENTLILSGGDLYQGSALSNINHGIPVAQVFNDMGLDATALGNHEFDWGLDTILSTTMTGVTYPIVCANLYNKTTNQRVFDPYKIIEKDGVKIAVIGAITNETPSIVMPSFIENYEFKDMAAEVNSVAAAIKASGAADVIVLLAHEGSTALESVVGNLSGIDAVLGGHAHIITDEVLQDKDGKSIPVVAANYNGKGYIDLTMTVNPDKSLTFSAPGSNHDNYKALDNTDGYKAAAPVVDENAKKIIDDANSEIADTINKVIGVNSGSPLTRTQIVNGNGSYGESYLGNWSADVTKEAAKADVGLTNNGGLRIDIPTGDITVGSMWQFMPFDNLIYNVPMNKSQLKAILEQAVMDGGKGIQVSGIRFSYDPTRANLDRIYNLTREDGTEIKDSDTITVAAPDFLATGGDGFTAFKNAGGANASNNTFILVRDALIANITKNNGIKTVMDSRINVVQHTSIAVLATSDIHGNIYNYDYAAGKAPSAGQGLARVSTFVKEMRNLYSGNVLLADNGDLIQGTPLSYYYDMLDKTTAYPMTKVMAAMGYDTWTLGNHEFNYGLTTLNRIIKEAKDGGINVLSANTYNTANENFVSPYYIKDFTINGKTIKVGILGLTTKCIPNWENPSNYQGLHFNDLVEEAKKWVPIMKSGDNKVDYVIVTAHSGEEGAADTIPENQIKAIAQNVSGIDAIVAGHAHNLYTDLTLKNPDGKIVPVVEPGKYAQNVARVNINYGSYGTFKGITINNVDMKYYDEDKH
ncbi:MAG: 5'-nucleotidase C-terminal domain-containing protein, partial [Bacillota bacterium]|nr:5'-nucleotidase C-terminal domain-containing protein [Bacillota bacterium]